MAPSRTCMGVETKYYLGGWIYFRGGHYLDQISNFKVIYLFWGARPPRLPHGYAHAYLIRNWNSAKGKRFYSHITL